MSATVARPGGRTLSLPAPRGPLTRQLFDALLGGPVGQIGTPDLPPDCDALVDDDLQLALYVCYEGHYARVEGVDEQWEWAPALLSFRARLEERLEASLISLLEPASADEHRDVGGSLQRIVAEDRGPALARHLESQGSLEEFVELVIHRSAYQLKEADPHSWMIPRLTGPPKAALLEIQYDEYGEARAERMHAALFAQTMLELGLDARYGAYIDLLPGITLATVNVMSLFGLHRRLRGALVGHLAALEMTSSIPNRRYGNALRRLGFGAPATEFYDEHVTADAVHESIAAWDLAGGLAAAEPELAPQILFGARALLAVEARWAEHLMGAWREGSTSLLAAAPTP
ncbi:MAG TPA: iron-containing redox enzyme family protein [Solirubrobacteraceae bacterium]|nr:iron-containing redox enzyme family protein [Solirubrobacteraceae bacterium]